MPILADVYDIRSDTPRPTDAFFADTNIWFWQTYSRATYAALPHQLRYYPPYVKKIRNSGAKIYRTPLCFTELAHAVEKAEQQIYNQTPPNAPLVKLKDYRYLSPAERGRVTGEIQACWAQMKALGVGIDDRIPDPMVDQAAAGMSSHYADGADALNLVLALARGISQVLSDDGDFATIGGAQLFTANSRVINDARAAGKLKTR